MKAALAECACGVPAAPSPWMRTRAPCGTSTSRRRLSTCTQPLSTLRLPLPSASTLSRNSQPRSITSAPATPTPNCPGGAHTRAHRLPCSSCRRWRPVRVSTRRSRVPWPIATSPMPAARRRVIAFAPVSRVPSSGNACACCLRPSMRTSPVCATTCQGAPASHCRRCWYHTRIPTTHTASIAAAAKALRQRRRGRATDVIDDTESVRRGASACACPRNRRSSRATSRSTGPLRSHR